MKPHGKTFKIRRRCIFCGMIVNDPRRFTWDHKPQTFMVEYGGYKHISYQEVPDESYDEIMAEQLVRVARKLGYTVRRVPAGRRAA